MNMKKKEVEKEGVEVDFDLNLKKVFNPKDKILDVITEITKPSIARQYKKEYIDFILEDNKSVNGSKEKATDIANSNLGYLAGYCDKPTRERINKLFIVEHPVFGKHY